MTKLDCMPMKSSTVNDRLSIIIVVKNRQRHLENTLKSIESNFPYFNEVIVVHMNQEIQPKLEDLVSYSIKQCRIDSSTEVLPLAKARNLGASIASSDTLLFLDVDCIVDSNTCLEYLKACKEQPLNIYMSKCLYLKKPIANFNNVGPEGIKNSLAEEHPDRTTETHPRWQLFWSLSFVINKTWFNTIGKFDPNFLNYGGEDTELSYRNNLQGGKLIWVPDAVVYHQPHENNNLPIHHLKSIVYNVNYFYNKHNFYIMENWIKGFLEKDLIKKEGNFYYIK